MTGTTLGVILILLHLAVCAALWLSVYFEILDVKGYFLPFMVLVPLWGPVCVVLLHTKNVLFGKELALPTLEKLRINEEQYRSILVEARGAASSTIPLEEALIVNSVDQRRRLILSILNDSPEDYIDILQQARLNDDTEVVHYASTAMAQISKDADLRLQKYEHSYAAHPDDAEILAEYCDYLRDYLASGLAQGRAAAIQRRQYAALLKKRLASHEDYALGCQLAQTLLELGQYDEADARIARLIERWPTRERAWLLRIAGAAARRDGALLLETERQITEKGVYLSAKGREALRFWQGETEASAQP